MQSSRNTRLTISNRTLKTWNKEANKQPAQETPATRFINARSTFANENEDREKVSPHNYTAALSYGTRNFQDESSLSRVHPAKNNIKRLNK